MGLAARKSWISQGISGSNTVESWTLRGRETVLGFHAENEVMRMLTIEKYASGTAPRMESRVR
jgi:hypothetical protein